MYLFIENLSSTATQKLYRKSVSRFLFNPNHFIFKDYEQLKTEVTSGKWQGRKLVSQQELAVQVIRDKILHQLNNLSPDRCDYQPESTSGRQTDSGSLQKRSLGISQNQVKVVYFYSSLLYGLLSLK